MKFRLKFNRKLIRINIYDNKRGLLSILIENINVEYIFDVVMYIYRKYLRLFMFIVG